MTATLQSITARNYRCLHDITVQCRPVNVFFGPNGVGKTTFLDALWFLRDCAIRGTEQAAADRHHGIGVLWDGAEPDGRIEIGLETDTCRYTVSFGFASGRIEPFVGEHLYSTSRKLTLIDRKIGSADAEFFHEQLRSTSSIKLRDPEKLAFSNYLLFCQAGTEATDLDDLLHAIHYYHSRSPSFFQLRKFGSESSNHTYLWDRWQNLWSALRNLHDRQAVDQRYAQVIAFMREGFPDSFRDLVFDQLGPDRVYASFVEEGRRQQIQASGVSDGHIQLLGLLTALFGESQNRSSVLIFDEPETSLHPFAIATFAKAVRLAAAEWNRQIFMATHSPVLMSQFEIDEAFVFEMSESRDTRVVGLADKTEIRDLLDAYSVGSLYMSEAVAPQSSGVGHP
jgi:predicted ATPase